MFFGASRRGNGGRLSIQPAPALLIEEAGGRWRGWVAPSSRRFILGVLFLWGLDSLLPHLHPESDAPEGLPSSWRRTTLMVLAVTLHNIPEGMAVGLSFALGRPE